MKRIFAAGFVLACVIGILSLFSGESASATPIPCVPGTVVVSGTTTITNDPDSGNHSAYWAYDSFKRSTQILNNCDGNYTVSIFDDGNFTTVPGEPSPRAGLPITSPAITGTFVGSDTWTVNSRQEPFNNVVPVSIPGAPDTSHWPARFFHVNSDEGKVTQGAWKWTYNTTCDSNKKLNEQWVDSSANGYGSKPGDGDITGKTSQCVVTPPTTTTPPPTTTPPATTTSGNTVVNNTTVNNTTDNDTETEGTVIAQVRAIPVSAPATGFGGAYANGANDWLLFGGIGALGVALILGYFAFFKRGTRVTS